MNWSGNIEKKRALQKIAAQTFEDAADNFSLLSPRQLCRELRGEAAFRYWLYSLDLNTSPPRVLPTLNELLRDANLFDISFGEYAWWSWPIWNTCSKCVDYQAISCEDCFKLSSFAFKDVKWSNRYYIREIMQKDAKDLIERLQYPCESHLLQREMAAKHIDLTLEFLDLALPDHDQIENLADHLDSSWGEASWWHWAAVYTCDYCNIVHTPVCYACKCITSPYWPDD